ncbi:S8 family peptidase [Bacillus infantis]|uniref:S8 family peptidase n=1 Tax=Bacillus infantis TaxID=324767 RepID=UPI003CEE7BB3
MRKWVKIGLSSGAAAALLVPSLSPASAQQIGKVENIEKPDILKDLAGNDSEQKLLAMKKQQEMKEELSSDTIIVKRSKALSRTVHQKAGTIVEKSIPALGYDVVKLKKGQSMKNAIAYYSKAEGVTSAVPSVKYKSLGAADPKAGEMYHLSLLKIDEALKLAGSNKVTVAVIDTGMDLNHPELKSKILPPYNAADPANGTFTDVHGTHVAGIIAGAAGNGVGGHGVSPNAQILPIDVFNGGMGASDYTIAQGILYAIEKGADVINMSLGGYIESPIFEEAVEKAIDAGITVVAAAGNESWDEYSSPASYEGVISVGSTNSKNELSDYSNFGASVDIVAPGEEVYSSVFDYLKGSSFARLSGTSMASPVVAGVAALLKSKYPDLKPFEIEAILEQTATDLGEKGYDLKYASGLVNPVAALKYDLKNLPVKENLTDEQKLKDAKQLKPEGKDVHTGKITKPAESRYFKIDLKKGEYLQTGLESSKKYDYAMKFSFIPDAPKKGDSSKPIKINDLKGGGTEGYLYQAEENVTLLIEVRDANGNYSKDGESSFTFTAEKLSAVIKDSSSKENITAVKQIPYKTGGDDNGPFTFLSDNAETDKDYFSFSVEEPQLVSIDLSGVAGVDSSLAVYFKEELEMERPKEISPYEPWPYPLSYANNGAKGEGEKLVFEAVPGMEYVVETASDPGEYSYYFDPFFMGYMTAPVPGNSSIPYELSMAKLDLPADEDGLPMMDNPESEYMEGELSKESYKKVKKAQIEKRAEAAEEGYVWRNFEEERVNEIKEHALAFKTGEDLKGYFQFEGDEDFYTFEAESDSIFEFELERGAGQYPWGTIYEYDEKNNDLIPAAFMDSFYYYMDPSQNLTAAAALEKGKKYFVQIQNDMGGVSPEAYTFKSRAVAPVPAENDHDENTPLRAQVLKPGQPYENSFIYSSDNDYYYYKHRSGDALFNLQMTPQPLTEEQKKLPRSVTGQLIPLAYIVEDTNGNMKMEEDEAQKAIDAGTYYNGTSYYVNSSFKAKKGVGYFIISYGYPDMGTITVQPYHIQLNDLTHADEDKGSTVKNNIPSKPLPLKLSSGKYTAKGYFNAGVDFGDKDYYELNVAKKGMATIKLNTEPALDGAIKIFTDKGQLVKEFDYYGLGDIEIGSTELAKGKYYIEVSEAMSRASVNPYELTVSIP